MKNKKLPHFKTDEEFGRFVDAHDMAQYFDSMEKIDAAFTLAPALAEQIRLRAKKRLIALRLPEWQISGARRVAKRRKVPYQALMRHWIGEGLSRELRRNSRPA
jgi:predicted DNA binding CopG/RHH family protein